MQYLTRPMYRDGGPAGSDVQGSGRAFDLPLAHELPNHTVFTLRVYTTCATWVLTLCSNRSKRSTIAEVLQVEVCPDGGMVRRGEAPIVDAHEGFLLATSEFFQIMHAASFKASVFEKILHRR